MTPPKRPGEREGQSPRVCVIGAGSCGLVALKVLQECGLQARGFDLGAEVGGLWDQGNENGRSAAYDSLRINTSREAMEYSDFPMDPSFGDYPVHSQIAQYLRDYATHFRLRESISFRTEVTRVRPSPAGGYSVELHSEAQGKREAHFDAVVVANGHHWKKAFPDPLPSEGFSGTTLHSHDYKSPRVPYDLSGKVVLVVGMGNSAMDIASELAQSGSTVRLSYRRGVWVVPRYLFGKPIDQGTLIPHSIPPRLRRRLVTFAFRRLVGQMSDFGLPEPDHLIGEAHPTLSAELPGLVRAGVIEMRPQISSAQSRTVTYADGVQEQVDCIIYCTGYDVSFPFLEPSHVDVQDNRLPLYLRLFHPKHRHLFFVGLAQPHGAIIPVAEVQARLLAEHLGGAYNLPSPSELEAALEKEEERLRKRYVASRRHTMQIDPELYEKAIRVERRRGHRRARRGTGQPFPRK